MVGAPDPLDDAYQFLAVVIIGVGIIDDGIGALGRQQDVVSCLRISGAAGRKVTS